MDTSNNEGMTTTHLVSLSKLCQLTGQPYKRVVDAIEVLDIRPVTTLDDARYFDADVHERINEHLKQVSKRA